MRVVGFSSKQQEVHGLALFCCIDYYNHHRHDDEHQGSYRKYCYCYCLHNPASMSWLMMMVIVMMMMTVVVMVVMLVNRRWNHWLVMTVKLLCPLLPSFLLLLGYVVMLAEHRMRPLYSAHLVTLVQSEKPLRRSYLAHVSHRMVAVQRLQHRLALRNNGASRAAYRRSWKCESALVFIVS